jgi:hypothetical protein
MNLDPEECETTLLGGYLSGDEFALDQDRNLVAFKGLLSMASPPVRKPQTS